MGDIDELQKLCHKTFLDINKIINNTETTIDENGILTHLDLSRIKIKQLYVGMFDHFTGLTKLDLSWNDLNSIPIGLFDGLSNLESLNLQGNKSLALTSGNLSYLHNLIDLRLTVGTHTFPLDLFHDLQKLAVLSIDAQTIIPVGILDDLGNLQNLDLNTQRSLDANLLKKINLKYLSIQGQRSLNETIFDSQLNLHELYLTENYFTTLSEGIFDNLTSLEVLILSNNKLKHLPPSIFNKLGGLLELNLSNNHLSILPEEIFDELVGLTTLDVRNNNLNSITYNRLTVHFDIN
ncbi:MAG: leucine-rich repeat protein [Candidatus Kariarchaeaceae archaeon]|jgi:Leucine-rich repeat (LRR) protein